MTVNIEQPPMKTDMTQDGKTFTFPWQKWFTQLSAKIVEVSKSIGTTIQQYIYAVPPIISDNSQPNRVRILHAESAVHPGTYNNVAVDSYGHVTTGSNINYITIGSELSTNPLYLCEAGHKADLTTVRLWNDNGIVKIQMQSVVGTWDIELWRFERNV